MAGRIYSCALFRRHTDELMIYGRVRHPWLVMTGLDLSAWWNAMRAQLQKGGVEYATRKHIILAWAIGKGREGKGRMRMVS